MKTKNTFLIFSALIMHCLFTVAQTETPAGLVETTNTADATQYRAGIYGIGSFGSEELANFNTSARLSGFVKPYMAGLINLSFNKSANVADSILTSSLLFPEIGNSAFLLNWEVFNFWPWKKKLVNNSFHSITPFGDFALQNTSSKINDTLRSFNSFNYSAGIKYTWRLIAESSTGDDATIAFRASFFANWINVALEDFDDFGVIVNDTSFESSLIYFGSRFDLSFNQFNIFMTCRAGSVNENSISVRELQGFNFMIGTSINADIIKFRMKQ